MSSAGGQRTLLCPDWLLGADGPGALDPEGSAAIVNAPDPIRVIASWSSRQRGKPPAAAGRGFEARVLRQVGGGVALLSVWSARLGPLPRFAA